LAKINWLDTFETGILFIDDDHKRLIDIIQNLEQAYEAADIHGCRSFVGEFLVAAKAHFLREEQFLQVISYQTLDLHAREHSKLVEHVVELLSRLQPDQDTGQEPVLDENLINDALYFLLEDIISADAEFKSLGR